MTKKLITKSLLRRAATHLGPDDDPYGADGPERLQKFMCHAIHQAVKDKGWDAEEEWAAEDEFCELLREHGVDTGGDLRFYPPPGSHSFGRGSRNTPIKGRQAHRFTFLLLLAESL